MLRKTTKLAMATAVASLGLIHTAQAEEQMILVVGYGFFPEVTYISEGDTVRFKNTNEESMRIQAVDGSWLTDSIAPDAEVTMTFPGTETREFKVQYSQDGYGSIHYGHPPSN